MAPTATRRRRRRARSTARSPSRRGSTTCASGSPKRTLNSSTLGPSVGQHEPGVQHAAVVDAPATELVERRLHQIARPAVSARSGPTAGTGEYAPIPPVLGPSVAVADALVVLRRCAAAPRVRPSARHSSDTSGPRKPSSITTRRPASPKARPDELGPHVVDGLVDRRRDEHPLARRQPVGLHDVAAGARRPQVLVRGVDVAGGERPMAGRRDAGSRRARPSSTPSSPRGGLRRRPVRPPGGRAARRRSASPATRGSSGPITYRSASSSSARRRHRARDAGVPGRDDHLGRASRAPRPARAPDRREPTTQTAHQANCTYWSRPGPVPDEADGHADLALHEVEVAASLAGQVGHLATGAEVGAASRAARRRPG